MQAVLPKWRNALIVKKTIVPSITHSASFHSTAPISEKWKNKWKSDVRSGQQPTKNFIRYVTRQKRADAKKALKGLLYNNGSSKMTFEEALPETSRRWDTEQTECGNKKGRLKSSARHDSKSKRTRRKLRREHFDDSDEYPHVFQATFGNRWYTWSFRSCDEKTTFESSTSGFEWREEPKECKWKLNESDIESETESDEPCLVGEYSDRRILGLPARGPLKIDDVKNAFRLAALRWHPDRHQESSQASAAEKFKECVNAYKSLCNALSAA